MDSGQRALDQGMIRQAIADLTGCKSGVVPSRPAVKMFNDSALWIFGLRDHHFGFQTICERLGTDVRKTRAGILARLDEPQISRIRALVRTDTIAA